VSSSPLGNRCTIADCACGPVLLTVTAWPLDLDTDFPKLAHIRAMRSETEQVKTELRKQVDEVRDEVRRVARELVEESGVRYLDWRYAGLALGRRRHRRRDVRKPRPNRDPTPSRQRTASPT